VSKKNDYDPYVWESSAGKEFGVRPATPEEAAGLTRVTKVILYMKTTNSNTLTRKKPKTLSASILNSSNSLLSFKLRKLKRKR